MSCPPTAFVPTTTQRMTEQDTVRQAVQLNSMKFHTCISRPTMLSIPLVLNILVMDGG